jgi:hypothetical protein
MDRGEGETEAVPDGAGEKKGGCLNLGWGCLSVWAGLCLIVPAGFWL